MQQPHSVHLALYLFKAASLDLSSAWLGHDFIQGASRHCLHIKENNTHDNSASMPLL
jgi:hypothetical protein